MKSLYSQYLLERTDDRIIETVHGFVTYRYLEDEKKVYITDIFVESNSRKNGLAAHLADLVVKEAKEKDCKELIGSVVPSLKNSTISMQVLLGYGMSLQSASHDFVIFKKDI